MEEVVIVQDAQAQHDQAIATIEAETAAREAELAAASAVGATVAQSQLISAVMEHAREDARESALDASEAARESTSAAETAIAVNVVTAEMIVDLEKRIAELEGKHAAMELERRTPTEEQVTEIVPENAESGRNEGGSEETETTSRVPTGNRRHHGRRRR